MQRLVDNICRHKALNHDYDDDDDDVKLTDRLTTNGTNCFLGQSENANTFELSRPRHPATTRKMVGEIDDVDSW